MIKCLQYVALAMFIAVMLPGKVLAEGTAQLGIDQHLFVDAFEFRTATELKVYIRDIGEIINIAANNVEQNAISVTLVNPSGDVVLDNVLLTSGAGLIPAEDGLFACPLSEAPLQYVTGSSPGDTADNPATADTSEGQYTITFDVALDGLDASTINPFDITVTGSTAAPVYPCAADIDRDGYIDQNPVQPYRGGRLHSRIWSMNGGRYDNITDANFFILVPGGRPWEYYTWLLDLSGVGGYQYEIGGNYTGVDSPNEDDVEVAGFSVPMTANSFSPQFDQYLNYPEVATGPGPPPTLTDFYFVDDQGEDSSISPGNQDGIQDTGSFHFTSDIDGTYAIFIDGNEDSILDPTTLEDVLLSGIATVGQNIVHFNGIDNTGNPMRPGVHLVSISLRAGEYHFVGFDIEHSRPGVRILNASNPEQIEPAVMYWNDSLLSPATQTFAITKTFPNGLSSGLYTDAVVEGENTHSWGSFEDFSEGNEVYIDTYTFGESDVASVELVVADSSEANISPTTLTVSFDGSATPRPGDVLDYVLTLYNISTSSAATDVSLTRVVPEGTTLVNNSVITDAPDGYTITPNEDTFAAGIQVPIATDPTSPGITVITFQVTVNPGAGRTISSQAIFSYDNGVVSGLTDSNIATALAETTDIEVANDPPTADDDSAILEFAEPIQINILDGDSDGDSGGLDISSVTLTAPIHGTAVVDKTTGIVTYTPTDTVPHSDSFSYTILDLEGGPSNPATVTIHVADSDMDGLNNEVELTETLTDPKNPDSDSDGLTDGQEVLQLGTNPNDADTDGGGVADGMEVSVDGTDPLNPGDDLFFIDTATLIDSDTVLSNDSETTEATESDTVDSTDSETVDSTDSETTDSTDTETVDSTDTDNDGDGVHNELDNCPYVVNPRQGDMDSDGIGNPCDGDRDGDSIGNVRDNCPNMRNTRQMDLDRNGVGDVCEHRNYYFQGGSCNCSSVGAISPDLNSGATQWPLSVLVLISALLGIRIFRRRYDKIKVTFLTVALITITASLLRAQTPVINVQQFSPSPFTSDLYTIHKGATLDDSDIYWDAAAYLGNQYAPLTMRTGNNAVARGVVSRQLTLDLLFGMHLLNWLDVGTGIPVNLHQEGEGYASGEAPNPASIGDVRLLAKIHIWQWQSGLSALSFVPEISLPLGQAFDHFSGYSSVTFFPKAVWHMDWSHAGVAVNVGYRFVENQQFANLYLSDELVIKIGGWWRLFSDSMMVIAELNTVTRARKPFSEAAESPVELVTGIHYQLRRNIRLNLGVGRGMNTGYGAPGLRMFGGAVFYWERVPPPPPMIVRSGDS